MKLRWMLMLLACALALPALAVVEIIGLPDEPAERYDLTWTLKAKAAPTGALVLDVEKTKAGGFQLRWEKGVMSWQQAGGKPAFAPVKAPLPLGAGETVLGVKRRPDTVAILVNHRLLFVAPAPSGGEGVSSFAQMPSGASIEEARYQEVGKPVMGDDFMRAEALRKMPTAATPWLEDDTWRVAYFKKDQPGEDPRDPKTGAPMTIPWQLSLFPTWEYTTNGFWYLYRGVGPSWVVANPTISYPSWDQYFVETAVKPEYDSEVGLIAAYQDNANYLLFRWQQRELISSKTPRAELIAVVNGTRTVLASNLRGFEASQWYNIRINLGWKTVQVLLDGEVLLSAQNPGPIEGRVGLYALGAERPRRPKLDEQTASMYAGTDETTGKSLNEAAEALRTNSIILFDDVRVGEWITYQSDGAASPYVQAKTGTWKADGPALQATSAGTLLTGPANLGRYTLTTRVRIPKGGSGAVLFHTDAARNGYAWALAPGVQKLFLMEKGVRKAEVDSAKLGPAAGEWADLRVEADGPYVQCFFNNRKVLEHYDAARTAGRCGFEAQQTGAVFGAVSVTELDPPRKKADIHDRFETDKWLVTWASAEADWYPAFTPKAYVTPAGVSHDQVGAASPLPTDQPGLYWHKGGFFHDFTATLPVKAEQAAGQFIHLSSDYDAAGGYRVQLNPGDKGQLVAKLTRKDAVVGEYPFTAGADMRLVFRRAGSFLVLIAQYYDPQDDEDTEPSDEKVVFAYRDRTPLTTEQIGFTVTSPKLPAAKLVVDSDRIEDTFERAPTGWLSESGVWAVMARYSCQPQWNWFGGFGSYTPTVWSKYRLDCDQVVEAYLGIKMQYDNAPEEYARRYRDTNVTICADGSHLNSGYSVVRGGRTNTVTILLRKGVEVARAQAKPEDRDKSWFLLPPQGVGHRRWFATRIEKRGNTIKVFLDNKLAMTYVDPDPIPGGYAGLWTLNNGIMVGRANLSAAQMTLGTPRAAAPLAVQEALDPLPTPQVSLNGTPLRLATFESGLEDVKERPGLTARVVRERITDPTLGPNTFLKVVNMYPAGDFSTTLVATPRDLRATPFLHLDYNFDAGAKVNLYVRRGTTWYEILLTGKEAQEANVFTAGTVRALADGQWHHLEVNLAALLTDAITRQTGAAPTDLNIQEMLVADWSALGEMRAYGFGNNPGGMALRFDNIVLVPALSGAAKVEWQIPGGPYATWRTLRNAAALAAPAAETTNLSESLTLEPGRFFFHLQGKDVQGKVTPVVHIPLVVNGR